MTSPLDEIFHYHEITKHHLHRHAPGPHGLDWANQPHPFRRYAGARFFRLELPPMDEPPGTSAAEVNWRSLSRFWFDSLAISAWKRAGDNQWALRVNPSSGNLHPTEAYLICGALPGLDERPAIYHYAADAHGLERRARLPEESWRELAKSLPPGSFFVGLSSILWREAWKYGERAFRYCQHDIGHALAAVAVAAARQGWQTRLLDGWDGRALSRWLGPTEPAGIESEHPDCLLAVTPGRVDISRNALPGATLPEEWVWEGEPNRLSDRYVGWPRLQAAARGVFEAPAVREGSHRPPSASSSFVYSRRLLHQRRSAVAMDGESVLETALFYGILRAVLPERALFDVFPGEPRVDLALFVHRVVGLPPGLYCLARRPDRLPVLRSLCRPDFQWSTPPGCPEDLPLRLLVAADCQEAARVVSCRQDIAADGCFSLGMLAEFEAPLREHGPGLYPRLFWECGFIGQLLYLEAERAGVRGTGIGCFFDEAMHEVLGFTSHHYQSLYHFTIGGFLEDPRITTLPPYGPAED